MYAERDGKYVEATVTKKYASGKYDFQYADGTAWKGDNGSHVYGNKDWVPKNMGGTGAYEKVQSQLVRSYQAGETGQGGIRSRNTGGMTRSYAGQESKGPSVSTGAGAGTIGTSTGGKGGN